MSGIFVEVAAVENHEIDVLADVAFGDDAVGSGALRAVLDGFAEFGFAEGFGLFGKDFFEVGEHAVFEGLFSEGAEDGDLLFADGEHGFTCIRDEWKYATERVLDIAHPEATRATASCDR